MTLVTCALAFGTIAGLSSSASAEPIVERLALAGSHPAWAVPAHRLGGIATDTGIVVRVYLHTRDDDGLRAVADAVSDPASSQYHRFLSAADVRGRFSPTDATVTSVQRWLRRAGLHSLSVPMNKMYVEAQGSAARVASAFGVHLGAYRVGGRVLRGADRNLSIPGVLAPVVSAVVGVNESQALLVPKRGGAEPAISPDKPAPPGAGFRNARPCSTFWGQKLDTKDPQYGGGFPAPLPYAPCGYTPPQLRSAYGLARVVHDGTDGAGATVAIVDAFASPTIFADASEYARRHDPAHPLQASQFSQLVFKPNRKQQGPKKCDASGWYGEETLDVEAVHAMAPGAKILYVGASDCRDVSLDKALNDVVANERAHIVSNSYGDFGEDVAPDEVVAFEQIVEQAAAQGIGVYFASGDDGDEVANLGRPEADFPASSPFVTAVGGTSLGVGARGDVVFETAWETGKSTLDAGAWSPPPPGEFLYGSGGGTSRLFRQPKYQKNVVPREIAVAHGKAAARVVPDISMLGDPNTGMLIGQTQKFPKKEGVHYDEYRSGGTSLSSPLMAGVAALADDFAGSPRGFINPTLYSTKLRQANAVRDIRHVNGAAVRVDFLNDVDAADGTVTSVRTFDFAGLSISTTPGYDATTGLGVPSGRAFLAHL